MTKRGDCRGKNSVITWTQVETGSAITWKYPSCILRGDGSRGEFYSIAVSNGRQQVDSGTKMIHLGKNTTSRIISKGIAAGRSDNTYRGPGLGPPQGIGRAQLHQLRLAPHRRQLRRPHGALHRVEERLGRLRARGDDLEDLRGPALLLPQRGLDAEEATALIVNGFVKDVLQKLPMEFAVEAQKLIAICLEGSVG